MKPFAPIVFTFQGKKVGHILPPGRYSASILKSRFNRAGNLELTLKDVSPHKGEGGAACKRIPRSITGTK